MEDKYNSLVSLLKIFEDYTDDSNMLTKKQILEVLENEYDINMGEKAFYRNVDKLKDNGYNIEIKKSRTTYYFLRRSRLTREEWIYLMCLIMQSNDLSEAETNKIIGSLQNMSVCYKSIDYFHKYEKLKSGNKTPINILKNFGCILNAIDSGCKVSCKTYTENNGEIVCSPRFCFTPLGFYFEDHRIVIKADGCDTPTIYLYQILDAELEKN